MFHFKLIAVLTPQGIEFIDFLELGLKILYVNLMVKVFIILGMILIQIVLIVLVINDLPTSYNSKK